MNEKLIRVIKVCMWRSHSAPLTSHTRNTFWGSTGQLFCWMLDQLIESMMYLWGWANSWKVVWSSSFESFLTGCILTKTFKIMTHNSREVSWINSYSHAWQVARAFQNGLCPMVWKTGQGQCACFLVLPFKRHTWLIEWSTTSVERLS